MVRIFQWLTVASKSQIWSGVLGYICEHSSIKLEVEKNNTERALVLWKLRNAHQTDYCVE